MPRAKKTEETKEETKMPKTKNEEPTIEALEIPDNEFFVESEDDTVQRFIHSSFIADEYVTNDNEIWNILMSCYRTGAIMPVKVIRVAELQLGLDKEPTLYFVCKLQKSFSNYMVHIPYKEFFTVKEREGMEIEEMDEMGKHRFFSQFIHAYVDVRFINCKQVIEAGTLKERLIIGSRDRALRAFRKKYFETGFVNRETQRLEPIKAGAVICNCKITRVNDAYIFVDVAGVPTMIPRHELSHLYITYASDHYQAGDIVDVKILEIKHDNGVPSIMGSVKALLPNRTLSALEEASKIENLGYKGEVLGTVTSVVKHKNAIHYNIATETGYNAIALSQKLSTLDKSWNSIPNPKKIARIGSEVKFHPVRRNGLVMIGYITDVFN